jgi:hypothetical protein
MACAVHRSWRMKELEVLQGFFQLGSVEWCLSPVLDEIIDRGWAGLCYEVWARGHLRDL